MVTDVQDTSNLLSSKKYDLICCKTAPRNNDSNNCSTTNPNAPVQRTALYQSESFFDKEFKTCYSCQSNEEEVVTPADQEKKQR